MVRFHKTALYLLSQRKVTEKGLVLRVSGQFCGFFREFSSVYFFKYHVLFRSLNHAKVFQILVDTARAVVFTQLNH